jgi:predicted metal-dependent HD superfamily phosphohydrolase
MSVLSLARFQESVTILGGGNAQDLHSRLLTAWAEPARRYHTQQHLEEGLTLADIWGEQLSRHEKAELDLGFWLHDAILDPRGTENERKSADMARAELAKLGIHEQTPERIAALVMATAHGTPVPAGDYVVDLLLDIDLAIIGAPAARFAQYEAQVRDEYSFVDDAAYQVGRGKVMGHFRAMAFNEPSTLYRTVYGSTLLPQARVNLAKYHH